MSKEEKYISDMEDKYTKLANEYNEVGRNILYEKYNNLAHLCYSIRILIQDGLKYRKLKENERK